MSDGEKKLREDAERWAEIIVKAGDRAPLVLSLVTVVIQSVAGSVCANDLMSSISYMWAYQYNLLKPRSDNATLGSTKATPGHSVIRISTYCNR